MKIKNVEKFREELYTAIKNAYLWDVETPMAIWKGNNEDYKEDMLEHYQFVFENDYRSHKIISLPHPMKIKKKDTKPIYLTVDEQGVNFYRSLEDRFDYRGCLEAELYRNRMSFVMSLTHDIDTMLDR